ncbi:MAG: flagellar brake protein [Gammaproteobacteria bacterium]
MHFEDIPGDEQDDYEKITSPRQIAEFLKKMETRCNLVSARLHDHPQAFTTAILKVDTRKNRLMLDELMPRDGNDLLTPGDPLVLRGQCHGTRFGLQTHVAEHGEEDGASFFWLPFPDELHYQQRRSAFRIRVGLGLDAGVRLGDEQDAVLAEGDLFDLSAGGFSVMLPGSTAIDLQPGDRLSRCRIELPNHGTITVETEIRHISTHPKYGCTLIGITFVNLAPELLRQVQRCVTFLEREQLRKQPRDD